MLITLDLHLSASLGSFYLFIHTGLIICNVLSPADSACFIDILFILDTSESARGDLFQNQKDFVSLLSDKVFRLKPTQVQRYDIRLAIMQFSSSVIIDHHFRSWRGLQNFKQTFSRMSFIGHGTYTYYAIANATHLFQTEGREKSIKVVLLMTDGIDHPNSPAVQGISSDARALGVSFITIGLSNVVDRAKLRLISGDSPGMPVPILDEFNLSDKIRDRLVSNILGCLFIYFIYTLLFTPVETQNNLHHSLLYFILTATLQDRLG